MWNYSYSDTNEMIIHLRQNRNHTKAKAMHLAISRYKRETSVYPYKYVQHRYLFLLIIQYKYSRMISQKYYLWINLTKKEILHIKTLMIQANKTPENRKIYHISYAHNHENMVVVKLSIYLKSYVASYVAGPTKRTSSISGSGPNNHKMHPWTQFRIHSHNTWHRMGGTSLPAQYKIL